MATPETSSNPVLTQSEHEEWVTATLIRIDRHLNAIETALEKRIDHLDELLHGIDQTITEVRATLKPLADHPDTIARGLRMLDGKHLPAWMTGTKRKD
jgi:hypothetical protein